MPLAAVTRALAAAAHSRDAAPEPGFPADAFAQLRAAGLLAISAVAR